MEGGKILHVFWHCTVAHVGSEQRKVSLGSRVLFCGSRVSLAMLPSASPALVLGSGAPSAVCGLQSTRASTSCA